MYEAGFECDFNGDTGTTLNKKVRNAQLDHYNFILVIGEKEQQGGTVNVRTRDNKVHGCVSVDEVVKRFKELCESRSNKAEEDFGGVETALKDVKLEVSADEVTTTAAGAEKESVVDPAKYC